MEETNTHNIADKEDFKNKYYALLEEHNKLLNEYKILVKHKLVDYLKKAK